MTQIPDGVFLLASVPSETLRVPSQDGTGLNERVECILPKYLAEKNCFLQRQVPVTYAKSGRNQL
jgi:hypothetical protein